MRKVVWFVSIAKMPRNIELSKDKICKISEFNGNGLSVSQICKKTWRSRMAVYEVLSKTRWYKKAIMW